MHENVVIIGRPNVGKSTLFNRIVGNRRAIVHSTPGTTRDRNENRVAWKDKEFLLVDTGGWAMDDEIFSESVKRQMEIGLEKADIVLFMVDGKDGYHPLDKEINEILRKKRKKYIVVVNKIDNEKEELKSYDFFKLGVDSFVTISAQHGRNINELLSKIIANVSDEEVYKEKKNLINLILVGKPNVGKSSLLNVLSKQERSIVHDRPGTTREAFDTVLSKDNFDFCVIDTPGLHRKRTFRNDMEYLSALSTHHAIDRSDIAVLVMDAHEGIGETEARIGQLIVEKGKGCLIVINKWDLMEEREAAAKFFKQEIEEKLKFLSWADILFVSAKTTQRTEKIFEKVEQIYGEYSKIVPKDKLSDVIRRAECEKPFTRQGETLHIRKAEQLDTRPPVFMFTVNKKELVHFSYKRFLENRIRDNFSFTGSPVKLKFRNEK